MAGSEVHHDQVESAEKTRHGSVGGESPSELGFIVGGGEQTVLRSEAGSSISNFGVENPSAVADSLIGEVLGHFRIDGYVGIGGMGAVFKALDTLLQRPVALKILPPAQAKDRGIVARFSQEARAAGRLNHENIARVYYIGEDRDLHFIAFEFIEGTNVRDLIAQQGRIATNDVVGYGLQLASALVHASGRGVVHRDIKPSNIIITDFGRAKMVDMGLARNFERGNDAGLTASDATLGTFDYISPEQAREPRTADVRSDIYSLGCTFYHMLCGRPPYPKGTMVQKLIQHQMDPPPDPRTFDPNIPAQLSELILRMMAKDPAHRPQTAQDLLNELLNIAAHLGLQSTNPEGLIWIKKTAINNRPGRAGMIWAASAMLIVGFVGLLWMFTSSGFPGERFSNDTAAAPIADPPTDQADAETVAESADPPIDVNVPGERPEPRVLSVDSSEKFSEVLRSLNGAEIVEISADVDRIVQSHCLRFDQTNLKIRSADPGHRPVISLKYDPELDDGFGWALFDLRRAEFEFEGIDFVIEPAGTRTAMVLFEMDQSRVVFRRCRFFQRQPSESSEPLVWIAKLFETASVDGSQTSELVAEESYMDLSQGGILTYGGTRVSLRECTVLTGQTPFSIRSTKPNPTAAQWSLDGVTVLAGSGPLFDIRNSDAEFRVKNTAVSYPINPAALVAANDLSAFGWQGENNLYHGVARFFHAPEGTGGSVSQYEQWSELTNVTDDGQVVDSAPWELSLALGVSLEIQDDPALAKVFRIQAGLRDSDSRAPGANFVLPWGDLYSSDLHPLSGGALAGQSLRQSGIATLDPNATPGERNLEPDAVEPTQDPGPADPTSTDVVQSTEKILIVDPTDSQAYATLREACADAIDGAIIELRTNQLSEMPIDMGSLHLVISAGRGFRPKIVFEVKDSLALEGQQPRLFNLRDGSLTLQGLDFQVKVNPTIDAEKWSLITARRSDVTFEQCSCVFTGGPEADTTLVHLQAHRQELDPAGVVPSRPSQIKMRNCFVVGPACLLQTRFAGAIRMGLENCAVEVQRSFLLNEGGTASFKPENTNELELLRCTIRVLGDFFHYMTDETQPWLPLVDVTAKGNIFVASSPQLPWIYFQSDRNDEEIREILLWQGVNNTYVGMTEFWKVQSMSMPSVDELPYDWDRWIQGDASRTEVAAEYQGFMDFEVQPLEGDPPWARSLEHFKLAETGERLHPDDERGVNIQLLPRPNSR